MVDQQVHTLTAPKIVHYNIAPVLIPDTMPDISMLVSPAGLLKPC